MTTDKVDFNVNILNTVFKTELNFFLRDTQMIFIISYSNLFQISVVFEMGNFQFMIPKLKNKDDYIYTVLDITSFQTFMQLKFSRQHLLQYFRKKLISGNKVQVFIGKKQEDHTNKINLEYQLSVFGLLENMIRILEQGNCTKKQLKIVGIPKYLTIIHSPLFQRKQLFQWNQLTNIKGIKPNQSLQSKEPAYHEPIHYIQRKYRKEKTSV